MANSLERESLAYDSRMVEQAVPPKRPPDPSAETRLVYSTGGTPEAPRKDAKRATVGTGGKGSAVRLRLERRASDRSVTILSGVPGSPAQVALLARELRAACGTGGTVRGDEVELQGDQREKVRAALQERGLRVKG